MCEHFYEGRCLEVEAAIEDETLCGRFVNIQCTPDDRQKCPLYNDKINSVIAARTLRCDRDYVIRPHVINLTHLK